MERQTRPAPPSGPGLTHETVCIATDHVAQHPILVVEDNPNLLDVLGMLLDYEQYRVALTADGQEALDWLALQRPSLVIVDWRLPAVGGDQVIAEIRRRYGGAVPILVLSAVADSAEAFQAGANAYLRKPYAIERLVDTIQQLLIAEGRRRPAVDDRFRPPDIARLPEPATFLGSCDIRAGDEKAWQ